eukprot:6191880-Pleurochrysis_carterae.AAC.2
MLNLRVGEGRRVQYRVTSSAHTNRQTYSMPRAIAFRACRLSVAKASYSARHQQGCAEAVFKRTR